MHNSSVMEGPIFFKYIQGPKLIVFTHSKSDFIKVTCKINKIFGVARAILKAFAGHSWPAGRMLRMPDIE